MTAMPPALAPAPSQIIRPSASDTAGEQILREQLLAQVQEPHILPPSSENPRAPRSPSPQHHHHHNHHSIDPAIAASGLMSAHAGGESGGDEANGDGRRQGNKRELSSSKRAAQNRAAQRAFRQRKEQHIKDLQGRVEEFNQLNECYKAVQAENYQLRDYIISLQSRLIESQGEVPQPPSNLEIPQPRSSEPIRPAPAPTAPMGVTAISQLQASALQAVVAEPAHGKRPHEEIAYNASPLPLKRSRTSGGPTESSAKETPRLSLPT